MRHPHRRPQACAVRLMAAVFSFSLPVAWLHAEMDRSRYMPTDEIRPGMKGLGRTVISGTRIDTFQFQVIDVLSNAFYAQQEVILVRCSGLDLENTGVIAGMSGSPCYIKDQTTGRERLIGAVAYSLGLFPKEPVCGIQPIAQMLPIQQVRDPAKRPREESGTQPAGSQPSAAAPGPGKGTSIGQLIAANQSKPLEAASPFSIFNDQIHPAGPAAATAGADQFRPLMTPVMVCGASQRTMADLQEHFERLGFQPVASGSASRATREQAHDAKLAPGSALCIPLMSGDVNMEAFGTCTEVDGDRVLGFGHLLEAQGSIELPMATGWVHMVIPSMMRSTKLGCALSTVGTLWGDEATGVFGTKGRPPHMVPLDVMVQDVRGKTTYHYQVAHDALLTGLLLRVGALESVYAHSDVPREHTVRYALETELEGLGTFRTANFTSQQGVFALGADLAIPPSTLLNTPFGKARVLRSRVEVTIEEGARVGQVDQATVARSRYKPGETVTVHVRWLHYRTSPLFTEKDYSIKLPADLPDGAYSLTLGSARTHLAALRTEKPHLFSVETLPETLEALNLIASVPQNRVYLRLQVPRTGLAVRRLEMPQLPSFQAKVYADAGRSDVQLFTDPQVVEFDTDFVVQGEKTFSIRVDRRMDQ